MVLRVFVFDGLPGSGKNYICERLAAHLRGCHREGVDFKDLDEFTQDILGLDLSLARKAEIVRERVRRHVADRTPTIKTFIFGGVSALVDGRGRAANIVQLDEFAPQVRRYWMDIAPRNSEGVVQALPGRPSSLSVEVYSELLEAARRATLREMRPVELGSWQAMPSQDRVGFHSLPIPPIPIGDAEFQTYLFMPLLAFMRDPRFERYHRQMFDDLVEDQYHRNRLRALRSGFQTVQINRHGRDGLHETICTVLCHELLSNCTTAACDCERLRTSAPERAVRLKLKGVRA